MVLQMCKCPIPPAPSHRRILKAVLPRVAGGLGVQGFAGEGVPGEGGDPERGSGAPAVSHRQSEAAEPHRQPPPGGPSESGGLPQGAPPLAPGPSEEASHVQKTTDQFGLIASQLLLYLSQRADMEQGIGILLRDKMARGSLCTFDLASLSA